MKKLITLIALVFLGFITKAQEFKIESNKILSIEKLAEIKGDTLFIYKDLDKALEILNKSKSHKPFKYVVIIREQTNGNSGTIYYPNVNGWGSTLNNTYPSGTFITPYQGKLTLPNNQ